MTYKLRNDNIEAFQYGVLREQRDPPKWVINAVDSGALFYAGGDIYLIQDGNPVRVDTSDWLVLIGSSTIVRMSGELFHRLMVRVADV